MKKLSSFLAGVGFLWMSVWSLIGSLLGARLNHALVSQETQWLEGIQRTLWKTAHAHMNSMSMLLILVALTLPKAVGVLSAKTMKGVVWTLIISLPLFGVGLCLEAFFPSVRGQYSWALFISGAGGAGFFCAVTFYGVILLLAARRA